MAISTGLPQIFPTALGSALAAVEGTGATRLREVSCSIYVGQSTHTCGAATDGAGTTRTQGGSIIAGTLILATRGSVGQLGPKSKQARACAYGGGGRAAAADGGRGGRGARQ